MRFKVELIREKLKNRSAVIVMYNMCLTPKEFEIVLNEDYPDQERRMDLIISHIWFISNFLGMEICDLFE